MLVAVRPVAGNVRNKESCVTYSFRPQTYEAMKFIADNMRQEDVLEVAESGGHSPYAAVLSSVQDSQYSFVCYADEEPLCIFGFNYDVTDDSAAIWLLGTDALVSPKHRREFLRRSKEFLAEWSTHFGEMYNYVSRDSKITRLWLKSLGFSEEELPEWGVAGTPFVRVSRKRDV